MIVTRRRFLAGSSAVTVAGVAVAKWSLPRLLPAPNAAAVRSTWTIGLLGKDGREVDTVGYERLPLDMREGDGYVDLVPANGASEVHWQFTNSGQIQHAAFWMPGISRPMRTMDIGNTWVVMGTLTLNMDEQQGYLLRLS